MSLNEQVQRAVLRGECYFCWLGQYDKCEANCNNKRAIPRYGNHDITPSGKLQLRSQAGTQTYDEWLTDQANKVTLGGKMSSASSTPRRDRSASIGVGGLAGRLSRFEILQENKRSWALRDPLLSTDPPKLSSLSGRGAAMSREELEEIVTGKSLSQFDTYGGEIGSGVVGRSRTPATGQQQQQQRLEVRSCRLPVQPHIPHKHGCGSVKVQVTPYSFAEINQRSALLAHERHTAAGHPPTTSTSVIRSAAATAAADLPLRSSSSANAYNVYSHQVSYVPKEVERARSPSVSISVGGHPRPRSRSPSVSVTAYSRTNRLTTGPTNINVVRRGNDGVVKVTSGGGPNTHIGGPKIRVKADDTSSYILTARVQSAYDMPLPELFQGLE